ncbi:MAG: aldehyde ferredoxin oxidoreductase family protein [Candidatus Hydrothermarchaeota archaeon]
MKPMGYSGKIARIDLTRENVKVQEIDSETAYNFIGGNGFAVKILYEELIPNTDPLSPENLISIFTGPVNGTRVPMASKYCLASKSPLTSTFFDSYSGGDFGPELKRAGYDGILIKGRAKEPKIIVIEDESIEILSTDYWGLDTYETQDSIKKDFGDFKSICIGIAGENLVKYANVVSKNRFFGRGGLGSVFGSKNLKAILARGDREIYVADYEEISSINEEFKEKISELEGLKKYGTPMLVEYLNERNLLPTNNWKNFKLKDFEEISGDEFKNLKIKTRSCPMCPIACGKTVKIDEIICDGPEYETIYAFGSLLNNLSKKSILSANHLCNRYGIDTISCGVTIACYYEFAGKEEPIEDLIEKIAFRNEIGDILAEGSKIFSEKKDCREYAMQVGGLELPGHSPTLLSIALGYLTSVRGSSHHDFRPTVEYVGLLKDLSPEEIVFAVKRSQYAGAIRDSMVICSFAERAYGHFVGDIHARILNAVTGFSYKAIDLERIGKKIYNLEISFNRREKLEEKSIPERINVDREILNAMIRYYYSKD